MINAKYKYRRFKDVRLRKPYLFNKIKKYIDTASGSMIGSWYSTFRFF